MVLGIWAMVKVFSNLDKRPFSKWNQLYAFHVIGGIIVIVLMLFQHFGKLINCISTARFWPNHTILGTIIMGLARSVAIVGYYMDKKE